MKSSRSGVLLAIGVLVAVLVFLWMQGAGEKPAPEVGAPDGESVRAAPAPAAVELPPPATSAPERSELAAEARPAEPESWPPADRTKLYFRGRCVAAESGAPLAGCTVQFSGWQGNSELIARYGEPDWKDPDPVVTGVDGRFQFEVPETIPYQFAIDVKAPERLGRNDRYSSQLPGGTAFDLGDVALQRGARVTMTVRDQYGAPVEKVGVSVTQLPMEIRAGEGASDAVGGRSDAAGALTIEGAVPAGTWPLRLQARSHMLEDPKTLTVESSLAPVHLEVRLRAMPSIEGVVLDERGMPVAGARVEVVRSSSGRIEGGTSDAEGRFRVFRLREEEEPVQLRLSHGGLEPLSPTERHEWGARDVRLQSRRLLEVSVLVRERDSGAPVEEFALRCHPVDARSSEQTDVRLGGQHPGGLVSVPDVGWGENVIRILPVDPALRSSSQVSFHAPREEDGPLVVELERLAELPVILLTAAGDPVVGSKIGLLDRRPIPQEALRGIENRSRSTAFGVGADVHWPQLWSLAQSDTGGRAMLHAPANVSVGFARVEGAHPVHVEEIREPFTRENPLIIRVAVGARLHGRLIHPAVGTGKVGVSAQAAGIASMGTNPTLPDADGRFEISGLTPGTYSLQFSFRAEFNELGGASWGGWARLHPPLLELSLDEGMAREVLLDASHFAFSGLRGRVSLPEGCDAVQSAQLVLLDAEGKSPRRPIQTFGRYPVSASHEFQAADLPPGTYEAEVDLTSGGVSHRLKSQDTILLTPGAQAVGTFTFQRLRLRLRLLDAGGAPLAGVAVERDDMFEESVPIGVSDAEGWIELDWMSPGPANLRLRCDPPRFLDDVQVDPLQPITTAEARAWTRDEWLAERMRQEGGG